MSRRRKFILILCFLGIGGFVVRSILTPISPALTLGFSGYRTNVSIQLSPESIPPGGLIVATFALTNQTTRELVISTSVLRRRTNGLDTSSFVRTLGVYGVPPVLKPGQGAIAEVVAGRSNEPVQVFIEGHYNLHATTKWRLFWNDLRNRQFVSTATNEWR